MRRQEAVGMDDLVNQFIREMKLASGINKVRVEEAWNAVSGAGRYTIDIKFDKGIMTCTLSSSVVRSRLFIHNDLLLQRMNEYLEKDEMVVRQGDGPVVRKLILR